MEGETLNIVSDTKNENDFRICCPFHMDIFTIIGTAFAREFDSDFNQKKYRCDPVI